MNFFSLFVFFILVTCKRCGPFSNICYINIDIISIEVDPVNNNSGKMVLAFNLGREIDSTVWIHEHLIEKHWQLILEFNSIDQFTIHIDSEFRTRFWIKFMWPNIPCQPSFGVRRKVRITIMSKFNNNLFQ